MNNETRSWYAVITSEVLYDQSLSAIQKLLVAVISNSSNEKGFCWASNKFFAEALGCDQRTIQRHLEVLEEKGYVNRHLERDNDTNEVVSRRLMIIEKPSIFVTTPPDNSDVTPPDRNVVYNNKVKNNKESGGSDKIELAIFGDPSLDAAWADWVKYRKEKRQSLTPTSAKRQIKLLNSLSVENAIACIERSIANGWTGLFPDSKPKEIVVSMKGEHILDALNRGKGLF